MQDIEHEDVSVLTKVYVRENSTCESPIEIPYYSMNREPLCIYCGQENELKIWLICKKCLDCNKCAVPKRKQKSAGESSSSKKSAKK